MKGLYVRNLSQIQLAKPWHYRREGVYYLRVRPKGSREACTVSLRSSDRATAMEMSTRLQEVLKRFRIDNPEAKWEEHKAALRESAELILEIPSDWETMEGSGMVYSDAAKELRQVATEGPMSPAQAKALLMARRLMRAAEDRTHGDLTGFVEVLDELQASSTEVAPEPPKDVPMTFGELTAIYMAEHQVNVREITLRNTRSVCGFISEGLGELNIKAHTRNDLVNLRAKLLETRKPSTVNQIMVRLSAVMDWGVNNGILERSYAKKLRLVKGAESAREAFTQEQVKTLVRYTTTLEEHSTLRWALSLGAITGARAGEVRQLRKSDVRKIGEVWAIDLNEEDGKDLKNKHSRRLVPLVDGAYGFDLKAFLRFVETISEGSTLSGLSYTAFSELVNGAIKEVLGVDKDKLQSFHSLRHSLASLLKVCEVPLGIAQAVLGHSSQSITFDHYGGNQRLGLERLEAALRSSFDQA